MILVTGATGHLGKAVVNQLLTKITANNIAILARDAKKAIDFKRFMIIVIFKKVIFALKPNRQFVVHFVI